MKIAVLMFQMSNDDHAGGILPYVENLCWGLKEIGHTPQIFYARYKERHPFRVKSEIVRVGFGLNIRKVGDANSRGSRCNIIPDDEVSYPYKGKNVGVLREKLQDHDVIILINVPSYGDQERRFDRDWMNVLKTGKPTVGIIHDAHWQKFYPWIACIRDRVNTWLAVHPGTFNTILKYPGRVGCVVNPFDTTPRECPEKNWDWVGMASFFKKWKHNDDGMRAAAYFKKVHLFCMGGGIELYNIRAQLKSRAEYQGRYYDSYMRKILDYRWKRTDPSFRNRWLEKSIYDVAEEHGHFHYLGARSGVEVDAMQSYCGGMIDFAYNKKWGEHFNRVLVEGILHGCIPFARPFGISNNERGKGYIFSRSDVVLIPEEAPPKRVAEIIEVAMGDGWLRKELIPRNQEKVRKLFDRRKVAKDIVAAALGTTSEIGLFGIQEGIPDKKTLELMEEVGAIKRFPRVMRFPRLRRV